MPFNTSEPINMAEFGLITDQPSNATPVSAWSKSLNVRCKDNSVQGVYDFINAFLITSNYNRGSINAKPIAVTQWTPAGSSFLNIAYIIASEKSGEIGRGRVFVYNSETQVTVQITGTIPFQISSKYKPQLFVFNEVLIMNPATAAPQYISADATTSGALVKLPGWEDYTSPVTTPIIARVIRPFNNRLLGMNLANDQGTSTTTDDKEFPIDLIWSTNITSIGSLPTLGWAAALTNSAGDAFLTATPGKILDGVQLNTDFIIYKSDSVSRVIETGDSLVLRVESILEDDGVYGTECIADIGNGEHLVIGNYGVYTHNGQSDKQDIAKGIFQEALFDNVNTSHKARSFVFLQTRDKEIWFCYSSKTNTGSGCDEAFVYDYHEKKVHKRSLPNILDMYEAELNGALSIYGVSPDSTNVMLLSTANYVTDGYFEIIDKDFGFPLRTKDVSELTINSEEAIKVALDGTYTLKEEKTYADETTFDPADDFKLDVRTNGKYLSLRVTMDGTKNPKLTSIAVTLRVSGIR